MVQHHPGTNLLTEHTAGSLSFGVSLCVAVHLENCERCRAQVEGLDMLGAELMDQLEPAPPRGDLLDEILAQLDGPSAAPLAPTPVVAPRGVPRPLAKLVPDGLDAVAWRRVTSALQTSALAVGEQQHQVSLIRMKPGGSISEHRHAGTEYTVVLRGGFSDHGGNYLPGDFAALGEEDIHRPIAHQNEDCICLTAQDGPIQFTGNWHRLLNPFLRVQPA